MSAPLFYAFAADALLFVHAAFVAFVVLGLAAILIGGARSWGWVRNPWFRLLHLLCIGIVVVQSWFAMVCPLTTWEMALRDRAGGAVYGGSFIAHWLDALLYYRAPQWVFVLVYSLFGSLVVASWFLVRPRPLGGQEALRRSLLRAVVYFALVFAVGFVLGVVRVLWLVPLVGERTAELLEMPFMGIAIVLAARYVAGRFRATSARQLLLSGTAALAMLLAVEFSVVLGLRGLSVAQYLAERDTVAGAVYLLMLALFAAMPWLVGRERGANPRGHV